MTSWYGFETTVPTSCITLFDGYNGTVGTRKSHVNKPERKGVFFFLHSITANTGVDSSLATP
jgi:hypothetical protein